MVVSVAPELRDYNRRFALETFATDDLAMRIVGILSDRWHRMTVYTATGLKDEHARGIAIALAKGI